MEGLAKGLEQREARERFALALAEGDEVARERRVARDVRVGERLPERLERGVLECGGRAVVDDVAGAQRVQPRGEIPASPATCSPSASLQPSTASTSMQSGFRNSRLDGLYGLADSGSWANSACSGLTPTTSPPSSPVVSTARARSVKSPMPQLRVERTA